MSNPVTYDRCHCSLDERVRYMAEAWEKNADYLLICYDDFDDGYYPSFASFGTNPNALRQAINGQSMQHVEAVIMVAEDGQTEPTPRKERHYTPEFIDPANWRQDPDTGAWLPRNVAIPQQPQRGEGGPDG